MPYNVAPCIRGSRLFCCRLVVGFAACSHAQSSQAPGGELSAAEYDALSAFIAGKFTGEQGTKPISNDVVKIVISTVTTSGDQGSLRDENGRPVPWQKTAESLRKQASTLQQTTIDGFRKVNTTQAFLRRSFQFPIVYELVDSNQLVAIFKNNGAGWQDYYKRFPGSQGIATFSRVGFSRDGTQALFYFSNICGGLCGGGEYVVMEKSNGRWMIAREIEMWIS